MHFFSTAIHPNAQVESDRRIAGPFALGHDGLISQ
jgi:hypothetical protein